MKENANAHVFGIFIGVLCAAGPLLACDDKSPHETRSEAPEAAASPIPSAVALILDGGKRVHFGPTPRRLRQPCKAIGVVGHVAFHEPQTDTGEDAGAGAPGSLRLGISGDIKNGAWLDLDEKSKVTTKDPRTGRELGFEGPGRIAPCKPWEDEAWVYTGAFGSVPGAGEGPGAEEWVVTPLGVVRYDAAALRISVVDPDHIEIRVATGSASLWTLDDVAAGDAGPEPDATGWRRMDAGVKLNLIAKNAGKAPNREGDARDGTSRCSASANQARDIARQIALPDASLSELAPRHVIVRRTARAACALARLRAEALPPGGARDALLSSIAGSSETWRSLGATLDPAMP